MRHMGDFGTTTRRSASSSGAGTLFARRSCRLARGSGRALRIFKAETKGLMDDDEDEKYKTEDSGRSTRSGQSRPVRYSSPSSSPRPSGQAQPGPSAMPPSGQSDTD